MLLRVSGQTTGTEPDLNAVHGAAAGDGGVTHGARLVAFTEAVMREGATAIARKRAALRGVLSPEAFVDTCAVIGAFNVVDRVADATGIPLDDQLVTATGELRAQLGLGRFASAANTPGARTES
jgi:hypothetical protein